MAKKDFIVNHGGLMLMVDGKMTELTRGQKISLEAKQAEKMLDRKFLVNPSATNPIEVGTAGEDKKETK